MSSTTTPNPASPGRPHGLSVDLDLTADGVAALWTEKGVLRLIQCMERCEPWAVDVSPAFTHGAERTIQAIQDSFNGASTSAICEAITTEPGAAIDMMGYLASGRALALFSWLAQVNPEIPRALMARADAGSLEYGSILVERISTLEKSHLMSRVFSPERLALVLDLLAEAGYGEH